MPRTELAGPQPAGFLRPSVRIGESEASLDLGFSLWNLSVPLPYVRSDPTLERFLRRRSPIHAVTDKRRETGNLLSLLEAQGCVTFEVSPTLSLKRVGKLFHAVMAEWYADYYSHPLWARMRTADISRPCLDAWISRTYYLSRSAGVTAARCAAMCHVPRVRDIFRRNAIEEFDHCERYYKMKGDAAETPPTISSIAFDQQMLYVAERDWLAHVFVALFQENTAIFAKNAKRLYDMLAEKFALGAYFEPWKQHIGFDITHGHAAEFASVFDVDESISADEYTRSVENARITVAYLIGALDEIVKADASARDARWLEASDHSASRHLRQLVDATVKHWQSQGPSDLVASSAAPQLDEPSFRCLSHCRDHDEIIAVGKLCEGFGHRTESGCSAGLSSPARRALENQLRECAYRPGEFMFGVYFVNQVFGGRLLSAEQCESVARWLAQQECEPIVAQQCLALCSNLAKAYRYGQSLWSRPESRDPFGR